jgi:hypothetical protein
MSETRRLLTGPRVAQRPQGRPVGRVPATAPHPAEPATGRALWPTFMRRTLEEDALREAPRTAAE